MTASSCSRRRLKSRSKIQVELIGKLDKAVVALLQCWRVVGGLKRNERVMQRGMYELRMRVESCTWS